MTHPCELFTSAHITTLRGASFEKVAENNGALAPDIYLNWDDEEGVVAAQVKSEPNTLLSLQATVTTAPRWFSLNIGLGEGALKAGDVLGLVIELETAEPLNTAPFIRTAWRKGGFADTRPSDKISVEAGHHVVTLLHTVTSEDPVLTALFHTLVVPLPRADFNLSLHDLRLFVIGAERGLRTVPLDMASIG